MKYIAHSVGMMRLDIGGQFTLPRVFTNIATFSHHALEYAIQKYLFLDLEREKIDDSVHTYMSSLRTRAISLGSVFSEAPE